MLVIPAAIVAGINLSEMTIMTRHSLCPSPLPSDECVQAGSGDASGSADLHRLNFACSDQLIELGAANADHAGGIVDAHANGLGRLRDSHLVVLPLHSARYPVGSAIQRLTADS